MKKRLKFIKPPYTTQLYYIENKEKEHLGQILKKRVGTYMHWVFEPMGETFFSAGCMDEIREFMKNPEKYFSER